MNIPFNIYPAGDHAITISFGNTIDIATHEKVMALFHQLTTMKIEAVKDIIPAYTTVTVVYDIQKLHLQATVPAYEYLHMKLSAAVNISEIQSETSAYIEIPVCYDLDFGTDLPVMSQQKMIPVEEIIQIHSSAQYHIYMLGFLPGFAYMGTVDDRIATTRLSTPRTHVAAGSVGIAGNQTGIYPLDSPGGWNIIGRTPLVLFDAKRAEPCLLKPGNTVQFVSITKEEFEHTKTENEYPHY